MAPEIKKINLSIDKTLENWEIYHALREIIANALDEQTLTSTKNVDIFEDDKHNWHIKDFGRGIRPEYFFQENREKLSNPTLIGKFGTSMKEAVAALVRNNAKVIIKSRYGLFTFGRPSSRLMSRITMICISPPRNTAFLGTEFIIKGITGKDMEQAKQLFLNFAPAFVLEGTASGQVLQKKGESADIYINGVKIASENNFLFSYNITALDDRMLRLIYQVRPNIERRVYADKIRDILLGCEKQGTARMIINDLSGYADGKNHDELRWLDVQENAVRILNPFAKVIFLTQEELAKYAMLVDKSQADGYEFVRIPDSLKQRLVGVRDVSGGPIRDITGIYNEYVSRFKYSFVESEELLPEERSVYGAAPAILGLAGRDTAGVRQVRVAGKMINDLGSFTEADGIWQEETRTIIVRRAQLQSLEKFAGTLLHELAHACSLAPDNSEKFEAELTKIIGAVAAGALSNGRLEELLPEKKSFIQKFFFKEEPEDSK